MSNIPVMLAAIMAVLSVSGCGDTRTPEELAELKRRGFHCLSTWDGSHREFNALVKRAMNDPDSFRHLDTLVTPVQADTGMHKIYMEFQGRNAFGGVVRNLAVGSYSPGLCSPVLEDIQSDYPPLPLR